HAANQYGMLSLTGVSGTEFNVDGSLESGVNDTELNKIQYSGTKFDYIFMHFDDSNNVTYGNFCINNYSIDYNNNEVSKSTNNYCNGSGHVSNTLADGTALYFNVTTGQKCSESDLNYGTDPVGIKTGCMRFYVFLDDEYSDTYNLLLDHNTSNGIAWSDDYTNGPTTASAQLKSDTDSWLGTKTPRSYTRNYTLMDGTTGSYTIDYSDYKARFLTIHEVVDIVGYDDFPDYTTSYDDYFFLYGADTEPKWKTRKTIPSGEIVEYHWLYEWLCSSNLFGGYSSSCTNGNNNYWLSDIQNGVSPNNANIWTIYYQSEAQYSVYWNDYVGIRPVIEVSKSVFK
ncbi:MAG: hypothetical protein IJ565_03095, partial [Bacilli bacterium]|nr:hypothetical protein [Bacilli bacterium]